MLHVNHKLIALCYVSNILEFRANLQQVLYLNRHYFLQYLKHLKNCIVLIIYFCLNKLTFRLKAPTALKLLTGSYDSSVLLILPVQTGYWEAMGRNFPILNSLLDQC